MGMIEYFKLALNRYTDFSGRSRRSEYWYFMLGQFLLSIAIMIVAGLLGAASETMGLLGTVLYMVVSFALIIPGFAVAVRRMHDVGYSGWMLLIGIIPLIGALVLLYFMCQDSKPGPNKWGPNPKETSQVTDIIDHMV